MLSEVQSKCGVWGRTELHVRVKDKQEQQPRGEGGWGAAEWESRWLNVNSEALAIVAEERWVGESDDDFPWC